MQDIKDQELNLDDVNPIDMEIDFVDDDDDSFGNLKIQPSKSRVVADDSDGYDDRPVKSVTGIKIDLSDDVPTLTSKPIICKSEKDVIDAVENRNTDFGLMQDSDTPSYAFGEDPDYMECSVGEDDDDYIPRKPKYVADAYDDIDPELVSEELITENKPKKVTQGEVEANYWEKIAKKHKDSNVKGAHNIHTHYGGDPKLAMDMFNHDATPEGKIPTSGPAVKIADGADMSTGGEVAAADGGTACCGESKEKKSTSKQLFENLLLITGFNLIPDGDGFILKDNCGMVDDMQCKDEKDCIVNLKPYIDDSFIIPLQYRTGEKFTEPEEWCAWYDEDKQKQYPKCKDDIAYCELIKNLLAKGE